MMLVAVPLILGMMRGGAAQPLALVADGAIGAGSYGRASVAHGFNASGTLFPAASGAPRFVGPSAQLLIERASQNLLANPRFEGGTVGVVGSGGILPAETSLSTAGGITRQVVGFGAEDGIPFFDLRIFGTQSNTSTGLVTLGTWGAAAGQGFILSLCVRLVAGTMTGINTFRLRVHEMQGTATLTAFTKLDFTANNTALRLQRRSAAHTLFSANADSARLQLAFVPFANQAFDFTWRIALPQIEPGGLVTSPILPPAGTPQVSARAAGSLLHGPPGGLPAAGTLLLDGLLPAAPGVERRLIAVETAGGAAGIAIVTNGAATSLSAAPFPSGIPVTGGATSPGARFRAAVAWDAGGIAVSVNGGAAASGAAPPGGLAQVSHGGASAPEALEIRRLELHPQRLSNAALAALTTLS